MAAGVQSLPQPASVVAPSVEEPRLAGAARCPRCGSPIDASSAYCFNCGLPLEGVSPIAAHTSGERMVFGLQPAGFWVRLFAFVIDWILLSIATFLLYVILSVALLAGADLGDPTAELSDRDSWLIFLFFFILPLLLYTLYFTIGVAAWKTTIGKRILRLYVEAPGGARVGVGRAFARYLGYYVSFFLICAGFILIGLHPYKRGLHDLMADTVVVKR